MYLARLLVEHVPQLVSGELRIAAVARRPGVLAKVAVSGALTHIGADHLAAVRAQSVASSGSRSSPFAASRACYIADALGLPEAAAYALVPALRHAHVLLGEIDLRGRDGWRGVNRVLASALTGWRIRLQPVAASPAWRSLTAARRERRPVLATVLGPRRAAQCGSKSMVCTPSCRAMPRHAALEAGQEIDVRVAAPRRGRGPDHRQPAARLLNGQLRLLSDVAVAAHTASSSRDSPRRAVSWAQMRNRPARSSTRPHHAHWCTSPSAPRG